MLTRLYDYNLFFLTIVKCYIRHVIILLCYYRCSSQYGQAGQVSRFVKAVNLLLLYDTSIPPSAANDL